MAKNRELIGIQSGFLFLLGLKRSNIYIELRYNIENFTYDLDFHFRRLNPTIMVGIIKREVKMKVICENYRKCNEPCLHRNPHDSSAVEQFSCRKMKMYCSIKRLSLSCISIEDFKAFPVLHNPLFKEKG